MSTIPQIDSVEEWVRFWDVHDLTELENELEEVADPVFDRAHQTVMRVRLQPEQAVALHRMARSKGVDDAELLKEWLNEKLRTS